MKHLLSAPLEFLDDFHGGKSSKRFWGNRLLTIGVLLALSIFATSLLTPLVFKVVMPQGTYEQCKDIVNLFIGGGMGLLFSGILENKFIKDKK